MRQDPAQMRDWYQDNLGLVTIEYGSLFEFRESDKPDDKAYLQWSPFPMDMKHMEPYTREFMINYRVENIEDLVDELKAPGVEILDEIASYEYGKFVHLMDPEGNKIEYWQPVNSVFTREYDGGTTK